VRGSIALRLVRRHRTGEPAKGLVLTRPDLVVHGSKFLTPVQRSALRNSSYVLLRSPR
jgi:hypothetical protein